MHLPELARAVAEHSGHLVCEEIDDPENRNTVTFRHLVTPPEPLDMALPEVGRLRDFYDSFGSVVFYYDTLSGDAAFRLAPPSVWAELDDDFHDWLEMLDEDDYDDDDPDSLPLWIKQCLVIGEEPRTGNYLLMPTEGEKAGQVFLFDHDGMEISPLATDLISFVERMLSPSNGVLLMMASHMRFVTDDPLTQWWIRELHDARGLVASLEEY